MTIEALSAITLFVRDMSCSVPFYQTCGFDLIYGGPDAEFTSFRAGTGYLNLIDNDSSQHRDWGRAIFYVDDVDAQYQRLIDAGIQPDAPPKDAAWGERYFHLRDPDGHELSFARPLK